MIDNQTLYNFQARIASSRDREHAWRIIQEAPEEMRKRLIMHAQTVFSIRRYYEREKAQRNANEA